MDWYLFLVFALLIANQPASMGGSSQRELAPPATNPPATTQQACHPQTASHNHQACHPTSRSESSSQAAQHTVAELVAQLLQHVINGVPPTAGGCTATVAARRCRRNSLVQRRRGPHGALGQQGTQQAQHVGLRRRCCSQLGLGKRRGHLERIWMRV